MTYAHANADYSQFELDNLRRYLTYEYVDLSNFIAGKIMATPQAGQVGAALTDADNLTGVALTAYKTSDYEAAVNQARAAYSRLVAAADQIHVPLLTTDWKVRRRAAGEFRKELRDLVQRTFGDPKDEMLGTLKVAGVKGMEGMAPVRAQLPATIALPSPKNVRLAH